MNGVGGGNLRVGQARLAGVLAVRAANGVERMRRDRRIELVVAVDVVADEAVLEAVEGGAGQPVSSTDFFFEPPQPAVTSTSKAPATIAARMQPG